METRVTYHCNREQGVETRRSHWAKRICLSVGINTAELTPEQAAHLCCQLQAAITMYKIGPIAAHGNVMFE